MPFAKIADCRSTIWEFRHQPFLFGVSIDIFPLDEFGETDEVPFEDTTLIIPRAYDAYLRKLYGDYMQLPPEEKRVSHPHYFFDIDHRLTLEELRARNKH